MVAAGVAMRAQDGVAAAIWSIGWREPAIGLVGDRRLGHDRAVGEREIAQGEEPVLDGADIGGGAQRQLVSRFPPPGHCGYSVRSVFHRSRGIFQLRTTDAP